MRFDLQSFFLNVGLPVCLCCLILGLGSGCVTTGSGEIRMNVPPVEGVLLDAGHGGEPSAAAAKAGERYEGLSVGSKKGLSEECYGSISASGYKEKTATLSVVKKIQDLLEKEGVPTALTRSTDRYVSLNERVATALSPDYRNWIFISIHFNRSNSQQKAINLKSKYAAPRGFEIYVLPRDGSRSSNGSRPAPGFLTANKTRSENNLLAEAIETEMLKISGLQSRGIKEAWFVVLRGSPMPSVLVEAGFLSNPEEGQWIESEAYQFKLAQAIVRGIHRYRQPTLSKSSPPLKTNPRLALRSTDSP